MRNSIWFAVTITALAIFVPGFAEVSRPKAEAPPSLNSRVTETVDPTTGQYLLASLSRRFID